MTRPYLRILCTLLVWLLIASCAPTSTSPGVPPALKHSWEVNFNKGDGAAVTALYAADAELMMSGSETAKGTAAIAAAIEAMIKSGAKAHILSIQNVGAGDVAYVSGTYTIDDGKGGPLMERGGYVEVWRRIDGAWKIVIDINAAAPLPTIAPATAAAH
ncbi:MAG: nuclear transport factor 2 family protein [Proteobacteria bacterium]|nr:nuclear transport factor 2 family protein [Pseudomonadota bacterium]